MAFALLTYLLRKFASYTCAWEGQFAQCTEHVRTCHATGHGIQPAHFGHVMYVHQLLARRGTCAGFGAKDRAYGKHCCCCSSSAHRRSAPTDLRSDLSDSMDQRAPATPYSLPYSAASTPSRGMFTWISSTARPIESPRAIRRLNSSSRMPTNSAWLSFFFSAKSRRSLLEPTRACGANDARR